MDEKKRKELIEQYKDGYRVVAEALAGAAQEELDARPAPNKWSAREIVHHLADSEMTAAIRLRLILAEDHPTINAYDQDHFSRVLYYDRPHESSLEAFKAARMTTGEILDRMTPLQWQRSAHHTEVGHYTAESWLELCSKHAHQHADQIRAARGSARKA